MVYGWWLFDEGVDLWTGVGSGVIIASGIYIVLREGTPDVSINRPVLENRSRLDVGAIPRVGQWLKWFSAEGEAGRLHAWLLARPLAKTGPGG